MDDDNRDRREMRAIADQFLELMKVEAPPLYDDRAKQRIGTMIGKAAQQGQSEYAMLPHEHDCAGHHP